MEYGIIVKPTDFFKEFCGDVYGDFELDTVPGGTFGGDYLQQQLDGPVPPQFKPSEVVGNTLIKILKKYGFKDRVSIVPRNHESVEIVLYNPEHVQVIAGLLTREEKYKSMFEVEIPETEPEVEVGMKPEDLEIMTKSPTVGS